MRLSFLQGSKGETQCVSPQIVADVLEILKDERGTFLRNVAE
jgi:hypothetical protein